MEPIPQILKNIAGHPAPFLVVIDGRCASGKTTLAAQLGAAANAGVVHMDDFYLPFSARTPARMAQPGGNMDFDRLRRTVLEPYLHGQETTVVPYNCHADAFLPGTVLHAARPLILEGSYSCHPILRPLAGLHIFLSTSPETQLARLARRDAAKLAAFQSQWIPREESYFAACEVPAHCELFFET